MQINTDSQFLIKCITQWMPKWQKNGWKLSTGGDVKNREQLEDLHNALKKKIDIKWVCATNSYKMQNSDTFMLSNRIMSKLIKELRGMSTLICWLKQGLQTISSKEVRRIVLDTSHINFECKLI